MRRSIHIRYGICLAVMLAVLMVGSAVHAADPKTDPNIDPVLPDPVPDGHLFPPAMATSGTADPGREAFSSPVSAQMLAGHGPGCIPTSPCAVNSPPLMALAPVDRAK